MALKAWKMEPKDISMLQTGGTAARMAALVSKRVDATVQSYPEIFQARKLGMNVLAESAISVSIPTPRTSSRAPICNRIARR
jgi:hypothetical protein